MERVQGGESGGGRVYVDVSKDVAECSESKEVRRYKPSFGRILAYLPPECGFCPAVVARARRTVEFFLLKAETTIINCFSKTCPRRHVFTCAVQQV